MTKFYRFLYHLVNFGFFFWHPKLEVEGREKIGQGGMVLCSNHVSGSDPLWILLALNWPHMIRIMAKQELRKVPFVGWLMNKMGVIFIQRGKSDLRAYKQCVDVLKDDDKLLIFIEGTRCNHGKHARAHTGAFRMAMQSGKPVVPVYVRRDRPLFCKMKVCFGEPEYVPSELKTDKEAMEAYADAFLKKIYHLGGDDYAD